MLNEMDIRIHIGIVCRCPSVPSVQIQTMRFLFLSIFKMFIELSLRIEGCDGDEVS